MELQEVISQGIRAQYDYETLRKRLFHEGRNQAEQARIREAGEWTLEKRADQWASLLENLKEDYQPYGLNTDFYARKFDEDPLNLQGVYWDKLLIDWQEANRTRMLSELEEDARHREVSLQQLLERSLKVIPAYLEERGIGLEEFAQVWCTLSGRWNTVDFERMRTVVRLQEQYPVLVKVANRMGRIADEESRTRFAVASGNVQQMEHASRSDIRGITTGNDLNSLLPLELAQSSDTELSDLFLYKYVSRSLQNFSHRSEVLKPTRSLHIRPARQKGPMIVCLDTSGSMAGQPERIGHSMLVKLLQLADTQDRNLYLIAFSVHIHPIDVRKERSRLQEIFARTSSDDTDATRMMEETDRLLDRMPEYQSADVLWITDFKMKLSTPSHMERMQEHRRAGTSFYGLRLAIGTEPVWEPYFDKIWDIALPHFKKYGK